MQYSDERGKVFVGGLSWDTTHASMLQYFAQYGEVVDCVVMKNQQTGKSRGFGFVTFKDPTCVDLVLSSGPHILDGRQIDPKACNPRSMNKGGKNAENGKKKVFVGGLPTNCTESLLKDVFSRYGNVVDVVIMYDQQKHRSRGFGFLTFESEEDVERVCSDHFVQINGKQVECKKAEPRDFKMIDSMATSSMLLLQHSQQAALGLPTSPSMPGAIGASATFPPGVTWTQPTHVAMGGYSLVPAMNSINYGGGWGATMLPPGADLGSPTSQLQYASATPLSFSGLQGPAYAPAHALQNLEAYALHGQPQAYTSGSLATPPTALGTGDTTLSNKSVYATGMSSITHQFGGGCHNTGYAVGPTVPTANFGGQGDAPSAQTVFLPQPAVFGRLTSAHTAALQSFHPYRR